MVILGSYDREKIGIRQDRKNTRLCQKYFMDFDDLFFVLLIRRIARSVARFYLSSCPINIPIYQITNGLYPNRSTSEKKNEVC